jgi:hypothetical protein
LGLYCSVQELGNLFEPFRVTFIWHETITARVFEHILEVFGLDLFKLLSHVVLSISLQLFQSLSFLLLLLKLNLSGKIFTFVHQILALNLGNRLVRFETFLSGIFLFLTDSAWPVKEHL